MRAVIVGIVIEDEHDFKLVPWPDYLYSTYILSSSLSSVRAVIVSWFNYGTDPVLLKQQNEPDRRYATDTCLFMRLTPTIKTIGNLNVSRNAYPWYQQEHCSDPEGYKHPYICEYEGREEL